MHTPVVVVPGLLGSRLCRDSADGKQQVVWGTVASITKFPTLAYDPADTSIRPCGLIREISYLGVYKQEVYAGFINRLAEEGYREGKDLFLFDYDWRLSVFDNARILADFIDQNIPQEQTVDLVAHSMGGLISRAYILEEGGSQRVHRLITAGTPLRGSVEVFDLLENGWGTANVFMGGVDGFRRTMLTFPSTFDLIPRYDGCCGDAGSRLGDFNMDNPDDWVRLNWDGVEADGLPDLVAASERQMHIQEVIEQSLPEHIEDVIVIGIDQRTPEQYRINYLSNDEEAQLQIETSWGGDGVVMRNSAVLENRHVFPTSFATHQAILNEESAQDFVVTALDLGAETAVKRVPVRPRTTIFTALGEVVALIGVSVDTETPIYQVGEQVKAIVRILPDSFDDIDASRVSLTVTRPGGQPTPMKLHSDPSLSDPTNNREQSFFAQFSAGSKTGELLLTATIEADGAEPRQASLLVPVVVLQ
ncbi:alpha/beta fold hydrolase [Saccharospirillum sp. HFRX-1]|uniref:esterase/lipase family protein n=1 Tax=unclassified Saccharospirillum TaxID=2633430 RepID=UPI00371D6F8C